MLTILDDHLGYTISSLLGILQTGINYIVQKSTKADWSPDGSRNVINQSPRQKCLEICTSLEGCIAINLMLTAHNTGLCNIYNSYANTNNLIYDNKWEFLTIEDVV